MGVRLFPTVAELDEPAGSGCRVAALVSAGRQQRKTARPWRRRAESGGC
jgi:hypothetical protein